MGNTILTSVVNLVVLMTFVPTVIIPVGVMLGIIVLLVGVLGIAELVVAQSKTANNLD